MLVSVLLLCAAILPFYIFLLITQKQCESNPYLCSSTGPGSLAAFFVLAYVFSPVTLYFVGKLLVLCGLAMMEIVQNCCCKPNNAAASASSSSS
jgi:hypothetical protein